MMEVLYFVTPHAQLERSEVIGVGIHIYMYYMCLWTKKKLNRTLATFLNIHGRTSHRIYRLALPLHTP